MENVRKLFQPNEERRERLKAIGAFFEKQKDGAIVGWLEIQGGSGVKMDSAGKMLVAHALKRSHRRYIALPGRGIVAVAMWIVRTVRACRRTPSGRQ